MLRIPHCLDNQLTDGGEVVSPTHLRQSTPQKHYYVYVSGTDGSKVVSRMHPTTLYSPETLLFLRFWYCWC
jgi:hypothetical protein